MKKLLVVLSIVLFVSVASANQVDIVLDNVDASGIYVNAFSLNFYAVGAGGAPCGDGTFQHPVDLADFTFAWANPPQVTRVVWTLDNYPFIVDTGTGDYKATGYAAFGPGRFIGRLKDGLVVTLDSPTTCFGINPSDAANFINLLGEGNTNAIGSTLQVEERWDSSDLQVITISQSSGPSSCTWDIEPGAPGFDFDVDGLDLHAARIDLAATPADLQIFAQQFGKADCS